jgi:hypothetical protein
MLHEDYDHKRSVEKKTLVLSLGGAWHEDELIDGKPAIVN